ncbi:MAG TPA: MarR family transcriptional regulator, partial [Mycobacterium sp.]
RQSLQDLLTGLRAAGLVETVDAPPRGRARSLGLTRRGSRKLKAADDAVFGVEALMLQGISPSVERSVAEALLRCAHNLENT